MSMHPIFDEGHPRDGLSSHQGRILFVLPLQDLETSQQRKLEHRAAGNTYDRCQVRISGNLRK